MTTYNDIIIPQLGVDAATKALGEFLSNNEVTFRNDRQRLLDFYLSQQADKPEYLLAYFNKEHDPKAPARYPHNLILSQVNVTGKLIDKKAKNYIQQPVRKINGKAEERYDSVLLAGGIKSTAKLVDRFTWLFGDHCVVVIADKNTQKLRFYNPPYFRPIFGEDDAETPIAVIYPVGRVKNLRGEWVQGWQYWDKETQTLYEEGTWNVIKTEDNPHGCFNVLFTHRMKPFMGFWTRDAQDLVDTNRDVNVVLTSLNNAVRYQGFPVLKAEGVKKPGQGDDPIALGFDEIVFCTSPTPEEKVSLDFIYPNVQWAPLFQTLKDRLEMLSTTWNVNIRWSVGGDVQSGIALKILAIDDLDDRAEMAELYEEYFEVPLHQIIQTIGEKVSFIERMPKGDLTLDWPEEPFIETPMEKAQRRQGEVDMNLTNPVSILMDDNPDLSPSDAAREYIKNVRVNQLLRRATQGTGNDLASLLGGGVDLNEQIGEVERLLVLPEVPSGAGLEGGAA